MKAAVSQRSFLLFSLAGVLLVLPRVTSSDTCGPPVPCSAPYEVVSPGEDTTPPGKAAVLRTDFRRGKNLNDGCSAAGCMPSGSLGFELMPPSDNQTPSDKLGYVVEVVAGDDDWDLMGAFDPITKRTPVLAPENTWLWVVFVDSEDHPRELAFTVRAVDESGNEGAPSDVVTVIGKVPGGGCG